MIDEETKGERQGIYNSVHKSYLRNLYGNFTYRSGTMKGLWQTQYWTCILINTMLNIIFIQNITIKILAPWIFSVHFEEIHDFNINIYVYFGKKIKKTYFNTTKLIVLNSQTIWVSHKNIIRHWKSLHVAVSTCLWQ